MINEKTIAEWKQAATDMHLAPTCEQALELIGEVERLRETLDYIAGMSPNLAENDAAHAAATALKESP